jgi:polysaccharide biosynthesis/export protein
MKPTVLAARLLFAGLLLAATATTILGQESTADSSATSDPQLKLSPMKLLQKFEPAADEQYALGAGDEISLDFPGHPELGGKRVVGPDGRITLSLVGPISVAEKNRNEVAKLVVDSLAPYYNELTVTVSIDKYSSNRIIVIGSVQHPGVLYFDDTPTLLDVIARSGLLATAGAGSTNSSAPSVSSVSSASSVVRDGIPERCAIYRGNDQVVWVNLRELLQSGNSMADLRLRRNDIVYVPAQQEVFVSVLGSVMHAGAIPLTSGSTLASVLAQAGGLAEGAAANIQVIQPSTGRTVTIPFKALLTLTGGDEVKLQAGDVVYVPQSGFFKTTYVIQRLSAITSIGAIATVATH